MRSTLEATQATATLAGLGPARVATLWALFHAALQPVARSGRLGMVVFQFHTSFAPGDASRVHVLWCRANLDPAFIMYATLMSAPSLHINALVM